MHLCSTFTFPPSTFTFKPSTTAASIYSHPTTVAFRHDLPFLCVWLGSKSCEKSCLQLHQLGVQKIEKWEQGPRWSDSQQTLGCSPAEKSLCWVPLYKNTFHSCRVLWVSPYKNTCPSCRVLVRNLFLSCHKNCCPLLSYKNCCPSCNILWAPFLLPQYGQTCTWPYGQTCVLEKQVLMLRATIFGPSQFHCFQNCSKVDLITSQADAGKTCGENSNKLDQVSARLTHIWWHAGLYSHCGRWGGLKSLWCQLKSHRFYKTWPENPANIISANKQSSACSNVR